MMTTNRIILQCRLSSSRLPAKALLPLAGIPSAILAAKRASNTGISLQIATSTDSSDDTLCNVFAQNCISYQRGPLEDVLARYRIATDDLSNESRVIRLTADNVFPDGAFINELLQFAIKENLEYAGTSSPQDGLPYGLSAEVFTVRAIRQVSKLSLSNYDREHVTPAIIRYYGMNLFCPRNLNKDFSNLRATLDHWQDYLRLQKLFQMVKNPLKTGWLELCEVLVVIRHSVLLNSADAW